MDKVIVGVRLFVRLGTEQAELGRSRVAGSSGVTHPGFRVLK